MTEAEPKPARPRIARRGNPRWTTVLTVAGGVGLLLLGTLSSARAQDQGSDQVVLQPENSSSRISLRGTILDYTGSKLVIRTATGTAVREFPAREVVHIETAQTRPHIDGVQLFSQNQISEAKRAFERALNEEQRAWVRRDILAWLIRCALREGDYQSAASRFILLTKSDADTRHFYLIPIVWAPLELESGAKPEIVSWLSGSSDLLKLIGASMLLLDAKYGSLAESALGELARSGDRRVEVLARAQLWRLRLQAPDLNLRELGRWHNRIETMPEELRGGPYYVLGRGYAVRREYDRAAPALLWVPLVHHADHQLAARACLEAADALREIGQHREAITLYLEVRSRFRETAFASEATSILKSEYGSATAERPVELDAELDADDEISDSRVEDRSP